MGWDETTFFVSCYPVIFYTQEFTCQISLVVCTVVILRCLGVAPQKSVSLMVSSTGHKTGQDKIFCPVGKPSFELGFWVLSLVFGF